MVIDWSKWCVCDGNGLLIFLSPTQKTDISSQFGTFNMGHIQQRQLEEISSIHTLLLHESDHVLHVCGDDTQQLN